MDDIEQATANPGEKRNVHISTESRVALSSESRLALSTSSASWDDIEVTQFGDAARVTTAEWMSRSRAVPPLPTQPPPVDRPIVATPHPIFLQPAAEYSGPVVMGPRPSWAAKAIGKVFGKGKR